MGVIDVWREGGEVSAGVGEGEFLVGGQEHERGDCHHAERELDDVAGDGVFDAGSAVSEEVRDSGEQR